MSLEELKAEILKLGPEARAALARDILASLDDMETDQAEKLWLEEAMLRDREIDNGLATARSVEEAMTDARRKRLK